MMTKAQPISQCDRSPTVETNTKNWLSRTRARSVIVSRYRATHERDRDSTSAVFPGSRRDREFHACGGALENFAAEHLSADHAARGGSAHAAVQTGRQARVPYAGRGGIS